MASEIDSQLFFYRVDGKQFKGYMYRKVNKYMEVGVQLDWSSESSNESKLGLGCKYDVSEYTSVGAKVNNNSNQIDLSFSKEVTDGICRF